MKELEYKVDAYGSSFAAYFRLADRPKGFKGWLKKIFNPDYWWTEYLVYRCDPHIYGYEQWSCEPARFNTPKEARDFYLKNPDGFSYNEEILEHVRKKHSGLL